MYLAHEASQVSWVISTLLVENIPGQANTHPGETLSMLYEPQSRVKDGLLLPGGLQHKANIKGGVGKQWLLKG